MEDSPKIGGHILGGPHNKDYCILGSILGSPMLGKLPNEDRKLKSEMTMKETTMDESRIYQSMLLGNPFYHWLSLELPSPDIDRLGNTFVSYVFCWLLFTFS